MLLSRLCTPALLYLIFSISQVLIDTFKGMYNTAMIKFLLAFIFTFLLNYLCEAGLGVLSWIIIFVPFILMSVIVTMLLFAIKTHHISTTGDQTRPILTTGDKKQHVRIAGDQTRHISIAGDQKQSHNGNW